MLEAWLKMRDFCKTKLYVSKYLFDSGGSLSGLLDIELFFLYFAIVYQ